MCILRWLRKISGLGINLNKQHGRQNWGYKRQELALGRKTWDGLESEFVILGIKYNVTNMRGPALTGVWSKAPPLTAHCLSPLPGFESWPGHVIKLPVT